MKKIFLSGWLVLNCWVSFAQAGVALPSRLIPTFEAIMLTTNEGRSLAQRLFEASVAESSHSFRGQYSEQSVVLRRLAQDDMETFSRQLIERLERLQNAFPVGSQGYVSAYRSFAERELSLEAGQFTFVGAQPTAGSYTTGRENFLTNATEPAPAAPAAATPAAAASPHFFRRPHTRPTDSNMYDTSVGGADDHYVRLSNGQHKHIDSFTEAEWSAWVQERDRARAARTRR